MQAYVQRTLSNFMWYFLFVFLDAKLSWNWLCKMKGQAIMSPLKYT